MNTEKIHLEILDSKRIEILSLLSFTKDTSFYLAGGTALALQIGHRKSIDFDFFSKDKFNSQELRIKCEEVFENNKLVFVQESENTLEFFVDEVKCSFFYYPYKILEDLIETKDVRMASKIDIACMKCSAICGRSTVKDFVDLCLLLKEFTLANILTACGEKFPTLDKNVILKSLVYFDDLQDEEIVMQDGFDFDLENIKTMLVDQARTVGQPVRNN